jgi:hypothetical protein
MDSVLAVPERVPSAFLRKVHYEYNRLSVLKQAVPQKPRKDNEREVWLRV